MVHLRTIELADIPERFNGQFPFNVPVMRSFGKLEFSDPVTFLVGENGSGKSTLMETLAIAAGSISVGSEAVQHDTTLEPVRQLAKFMRLTWQKRTHKGFYMRAEDFFGYARRIAAIQSDLRRDLEAVDEEYQGRSDYAKALAKMSYQGELGALKKSYGNGLDSRSHGESFLMLFQERFIPGGLYLLDEPEAPLSPVRQLSLLAILKRMVAQDAQFIIATHSPILMAFPGALILNFDSGQIQRTDYADIEHVQVTRDFLNNPGLYLRHLGEDEDE